LHISCIYFGHPLDYVTWQSSTESIDFIHVCFVLSELRLRSYFVNWQLKIKTKKNNNNCKFG
jgi:hypothetical protein